MKFLRNTAARNTALFVILIVVVSPFLLPVVIPLLMSRHDIITEEKVAQLVYKELPPGASMTDMDGFMRRHNAVYSFDEYDMRYIGLLPQSKFDRWLADRNVQVVLVVNRTTKMFARSEVHVSYTGP